jgi:hypothetical protein
MNLPVLCVRLRDYTDGGFDLGAFSAAPRSQRSLEIPMRAIGECFAFKLAALNEEANRLSHSAHQWLLQLAIAGLWEEQPKKPAYVCYTLHGDIVRLFLCSRHKRHPVKFYGIVSKSGAYIESGQDGFQPEQARPLASWAPPCSASALWPSGLDGNTNGARVIDTGNLLAWFSYPESDHDQSVPVDMAGLEYLRVPQTELSSFNFTGRDYHYLNRWATVDISLPR